MKFIATIFWFISLLITSVLFISLLAAVIHFIWNGENEKVTTHLLTELVIFWLASSIVTYLLGLLRNGIGYQKKQKSGLYSYSKKEAAQPNVPFNI